MRPRTSDLPGLGTALNVDAVVSLLERALGARSLSGLSILDVRYRPDGPCWILYRLKGKSTSGRSIRQLLSARLLRSGEEPEPIPSDWVSRYEAFDDTLVRTPMVHLTDVPMVVYPYPIDASLPGLFDAADPSRLKAHLNRVWAARKMRVLAVEARSLGYTPGARAAFLYRVLSESRETGVPELRHFIGKMHAKKPAARLFADAWALWRAGKGKLAVAPPVGYVGAIGLTLQEKVGGVRLGGVVDEPHFVQRVRRTARVLAFMHQLRVPLSTRRKPADEASSVHRWAGVLTVIRPDLSRRVVRLRDRLASRIESHTTLSAPIHADFHHTNVLVDGDRVTVIDLDEMAFGDPMVDVGRFLASLRVPARRAFGNIDALQDAGEAFLQEYLKRAGGDERRARLFEAASLLISAGSSFRIQRIGWEEEVRLLVSESERVLERTGRTVHGGGSDPKPLLDSDEQWRWANDTVYMQASLDPPVRSVYGADLTSCRVACRDDKRLRYHLKGHRGDERWSVTLEGAFGCERGGHRIVRRLEQLNRKLQDLPGAPLLPLPIAYLKQLSLLLWEVRAGTRFSDLIARNEGPGVAIQIAHALAALHDTTVELETRPLERELRAVRERVDGMAEARSELAAPARELLKEVEERSFHAPSRLGPVMRTVNPHHVLCMDGKIAFDRVENVSLSHPLIDAGDFLARLALFGFARKESARAEKAAMSFREVYSEAGDARLADISTFEAGALLRLASMRAHRGPEGTLPKLLVGRAETLLGGR